MNIAIIAAAGAGTRMASDRPKQFLLLAGTPVIFHTLKVFEQCDSIHEVIVVLPAEESAGFLSMAGKMGLRKVARVVPGGATRAESVKRGLMSIRSATAEIVAVHDGVRPFVPVDEISNTVAAAQADGGASAALVGAKLVMPGPHLDGKSLYELFEAEVARGAANQHAERNHDHEQQSQEDLADRPGAVEAGGETDDALAERATIVVEPPALPAIPVAATARQLSYDAGATTMQMSCPVPT